MTDTEILDWYVEHFPRVTKCVGKGSNPFFVLIMSPTHVPIAKDTFREVVELAAAVLELENS